MGEGEAKPRFDAHEREHLFVEDPVEEAGAQGAPRRRPLGGTEGGELKAELGAAATANAPTPPASARVQAKGSNSAAVAEQAERIRESAGGKSNATNAAAVEGSLSRSRRVRKKRMLADM